VLAKLVPRDEHTRIELDSHMCPEQGRELALHCSRFILQLQYWTAVERNDFGYTFGYRHQFAKIQMGMVLASSLITLTFPYCHRFTSFFRDLKSADPYQVVGFKSPPGTNIFTRKKCVQIELLLGPPY
jgi:hypothetical protein